jgi:hypothetical protein
MRLFLPALTLMLFMAGPAPASTPTSRQFGPWFVTSVTSLSGTGGDDASAVLVQEYPAGRIALDWRQGIEVYISIRIENCTDEDNDLGHQYGMSPADMAHMPLPRLIAQLESDFSVWLAEARRTCRHPERLRRFRLERLAEALADYVDRVRYLDSIQ